MSQFNQRKELSNIQITTGKRNLFLAKSLAIHKEQIHTKANKLCCKALRIPAHLKLKIEWTLKQESEYK